LFLKSLFFKKENTETSLLNARHTDTLERVKENAFSHKCISITFSSVVIHGENILQVKMMVLMHRNKKRMYLNAKENFFSSKI